MGLNTETFLNTAVENEMETELLPVPEGEYRAVVAKIDLRSFDIKRGDRAGQTGYALDLTWEIQDDQVKEDIGRVPKPRQSIMLDIQGDTLAEGKGKNVGLGRVRAALDMNDASQPWTPSMLVGAVANVEVKHRVYEGRIFDEVSRVREL